MPEEFLDCQSALLHWRTPEQRLARLRVWIFALTACVILLSGALLWALVAK